MRRESRPSARRTGSGHTLWEVLLVLALIGAIAGVVIPVASRRRPLDDSMRVTRDIQELLSRARLTALERGVAVNVVLDTRAGRAWVMTRTADSLHVLGTSTLSHAPAVALLGVARLQYTFTADGLAYGDTVVIAGPGTRRRIVVDSWSGAVHVLER